MTRKSFQNQPDKAESEDSLFGQNNIAGLIFCFFLFFLPTQLGLHFWPSFTYIQGLRIDYLSPTLYLTDLIFFTLLLFELNKSKHKIIPLIKKHKQILSVAILITLLLLIKLLNSNNFLAGVYSLLKIFEMVSIFVYSAYIISKKKYISYIAVSLALGVILEVSLALLQLHYQGSVNGVFYFLGERFFTSETPGIANASINGTLFLRPYSTFPHPNALAGYLVIVQLVLLAFITQIKSRVRVLVQFAIALSFLGILISLSRVVILIECFLVLYYGMTFFSWKKTRLLKARYLLLPLIAVIIIIYVSLPRITNSSLKEVSVIERQTLMQESLKIIINSPLSGVGLNNFLNELSLSKNTQTQLQPVHNIPLHLSAELGLPISLVIMYLYLAYFKKVWKSKMPFGIKRKEALLLLSVIFVLSMIDHYLRTLQQTQLLLAVILGLIYGSTRRSNFKSAKSSSD